MNLQTPKIYTKLFSIFLNVQLVFLITVAAANGSTVVTNKTVADFDGDGKSDIAVYRQSDNYWYIWKSSGGYLFIPWGKSGDQPLPGDYDGDGKTDFAVFREGASEFMTSNHWYILRSSDYMFKSIGFGLVENHNTSYFGLPADYDGDGKTDMTTFTSSFNVPEFTITAKYYDVLQSSTNSTIRKVLPLSFSASVVPADFDGDGKADFTIYSNGLWTIEQSLNGAAKTISFGLSDDKTVPADYDGDGKADIAVWRPSTGYWYWLSSRDGSFNSYQFGQSGDTTVPGDYDGDGKTDFAVFRRSGTIGIWYIQQSRNGFRAEQFGLSGDIPL